jgi:carboxyvinyl-carboxyphosphonate phosphorylmutase
MPKDHPGAQIRKLLAEPGILIVPGAYDALTARVIEDSGFPVVYATGAGISNSQLGLADKGLLSFGEVLHQVGRIVEATNLPVIADADTGYGGPANVIRTVREFSRVGVGGIQLEDQVFPKQCGHFEGSEVIPLKEMVGKIHAALDAREDESLVIIARTDARRSLGLEDALERAQAYAEAGADLTFVEAPLTREEMVRIPKEVPVPQLANMVEGGKTPLLEASELEQMGYKVALFANCTLRAGVKAIQHILKVLMQEGTTAGHLESLISMEERNRLTDLERINELERKYG